MSLILQLIYKLKRSMASFHFPDNRVMIDASIKAHSQICYVHFYYQDHCKLQISSRIFQKHWAQKIT